MKMGRTKIFSSRFFILKSFVRHLGRPRWVINHFWTLWRTPETIIWKSIFLRFSTFHEIFNAGDQFHCWPSVKPQRLWRLVKCIFWVCPFYFSESTYFGESAKKFWTKNMVAFSFSAARRRQRPHSEPLSKIRSKNTRSPLIMRENGPNKNFHFPFFYFKIVCETLREVQVSSKPFLNTLGHSWNNNLKIDFLEIFDFSWDFQCWRPIPLLTCGEARALMAFSNLDFLGMLVLFFQKYILRKVCKKILNKKYGRVFVLKPPLKTVTYS